MTFKEMLAQDAAEVFFDLEEFAEIVEIDGVKLPAILTQETRPRKSLNLRGAMHTRPELHNQPLIGKEITVYFKTADYMSARGRIPKNNEFCRIDGIRYKVAESIDNAGITRLLCDTDAMNTPPKPQMTRLPALYKED